MQQAPQLGQLVLAADEAADLGGEIVWRGHEGRGDYRALYDLTPSRPTIVPVSSTPSSDDAFAEVKAKVDLVKVIQEHVRLTKRNRELWGLCPFHQEDSPSFKVNPQMQSWYCFGCQRHGDVFTFVELIEKTDKRGALQMLAERAGVELHKLSPEQKERSDSRKRLLAMLKLAAQYYEYVLWSSPSGEPGRRLLVQRQVGEETARRFQPSICARRNARSAMRRWRD